MTLDLEQFRATKRPCDDATWNDLVEGGEANDFTFTQADALLYADGYMIHLQDGKYWVHAWWYSPLAYDTLEEAEAKLHPWYLEFNS